jgi:hypothetical protein
MLSRLSVVWMSIRDKMGRESMWEVRKLNQSASSRNHHAFAAYFIVD